MDNHLRHIADAPAILLDAIGPIKIFTVHKKGLIEQTCLAHDSAAQKHARSNHRIDLSLLIRVAMGHVVATKARAARKQPRETAHMVERDLGCGKGAAASAIERAIAKQQLRP